MCLKGLPFSAQEHGRLAYVCGLDKKSVPTSCLSSPQLPATNFYHTSLLLLQVFPIFFTDYPHPNTSCSTPLYRGLLLYFRLGFLAYFDSIQACQLETHVYKQSSGTLREPNLIRLPATNTTS